VGLQRAQRGVRFEELEEATLILQHRRPNPLSPFSLSPDMPPHAVVSRMEGHS